MPMNLLKLREGVDVAPITMGLARHPELWGQYTLRAKSDKSPHAGSSDIWVRYRDLKEFDGDVQCFNGPHFPIWYPAWWALPEIQPLTYDLMRTFRAAHLGGILITRIPPGGRIRPHVDSGSWHAAFYETKLYIVLQGNDRCRNRVGEEWATMRTGEVWYFNNLIEHEVVNDGETDRITLIVCLRCE